MYDKVDFLRGRAILENFKVKHLCFEGQYYT